MCMTCTVTGWQNTFRGYNRAAKEAIYIVHCIVCIQPGSFTYTVVQCLICLQPGTWLKRLYSSLHYPHSARWLLQN